jgi:hypothetical protein
MSFDAKVEHGGHLYALVPCFNLTSVVMPLCFVDITTLLK